MKAGAPAAFALCLAAAPALAQAELAVGDPAPSFTLPLYNPAPGGPTTASLDGYVGPEAEDKGTRALLLSFFATFCAPCKRELPYLEWLEEQYRAAGLRVLVVSIDRDEGAAAKIAALAAQDHLTFPILRDRFDVLARRYLGEQAPLPSLFLVDRAGVIRQVERGYGKDASSFLLASVREALGLSKPGAPH